MIRFFKFLVLFITIGAISNGYSQKNRTFKAKKVYQSKNLVITQIAQNAFKHVSFLQTESFGNVPCNGLMVRNGKEAIIFDTPTNDTASEELIKWIHETQNANVVAIIPTHFHDDCLGGLKAFHAHQIPSFANFKTIELAQKNSYEVPQNGFQDSLSLKLGNQTVFVKFIGEGHTKDNVVGYFPADKILFGGCLIKELNATKGYLGDANVLEWSNTVEKVKNTFPNVQIVVPGHGEIGDKKLLDYTYKLFKPE